MADIKVNRNEILALYYKYIEERLKPVLQNAFNEAIENGGALWDYVADLVLDGIQSKVYGVYSPRKYQRREEDGGLKDKDNIVIDGGEITFNKNGFETSFNIRNITGPGPIEDADGNIITGGGGPIEPYIIGGYGSGGYRFPYPKGAAFLKKRNFYAVYNEKYKPDDGGHKIWDGVHDEIESIEAQALSDAIIAVVTSKL